MSKLIRQVYSYPKKGRGIKVTVTEFSDNDKCPKSKHA